MSGVGELAHELINQRIEQERSEGVKTASLAVSQTGCDQCADCGDDIPTERRKAAPFARRCITCQQTFENEKT